MRITLHHSSDCVCLTDYHQPPLQCAADLDPCCTAEWLRREIQIWGRTRCWVFRPSITIDGLGARCASARIVAGLGDGRRLLAAGAGRLRSRWVGHAPLDGGGLEWGLLEFDGHGRWLEGRTPGSDALLPLLMEDDRWPWELDDGGRCLPCSRDLGCRIPASDAA
ncbi:hypothetical protein ACLOJK_019310 [Asimina triloba]